MIATLVVGDSPVTWRASSASGIGLATGRRQSLQGRERRPGVTRAVPRRAPWGLGVTSLDPPASSTGQVSQRARGS